MNKKVFLLIAFAAIAVCGQVVEEYTPEILREHAIEFLGLCGLDIQNGDVLTVTKESVSPRAKPGHALYSFDIGDDRLTIDTRGTVREYLGSLERSSSPAKNVELLSKKLLRAVLPKDMVVARPRISDDGARAVHYTFQRTIRGIPVEGQRLRMAFDIQTGDLLYVKNTLKVIEEFAIDLPPAIEYKQAIQQAITTVYQDLDSERWKGLFDPEAAVLLSFDRSGTRSDTKKKSRKDLIIAPRNARFHPKIEPPISPKVEKWTIAYDIPIEIQPRQGSQRSESFKLFVRVWVDARSGEVIGGE